MPGIDLCPCGGKRIVKYQNGFLCGKHYYRLRKYGNPFIKLVTDFNEYVEQKNYSEILLDGGKKSIIDKDDFDLVKGFKWYLRKDGYVFNSRNRITIHQLIMGKKDGFEIDHINGVRLDNRKDNLRFVTKEGNARNRRNVAGVRKTNNKWQAYITVSGKQKHLGMLNTENKAVLARRKAEKQFFPRFYNRVNKCNI